MGIYLKLKYDYSRYRKGKPSLLRIFILSISKPGFRAVLLYRISNFLLNKKLNFLCSIIQKIMHHACHCYINPNAVIGKGFLIAHVGGIVIGHETIIGDNCDIRHNVTFGGNYNKKNSDGRSQPILKDNVSIGAGACILGPVVIGKNSIIGANSVVVRDIAEGKIASGIPAKEIKDVWKIDEKRGL